MLDDVQHMWFLFIFQIILTKKKRIAKWQPCSPFQFSPDLHKGWRRRCWCCLCLKARFKRQFPTSKSLHFHFPGKIQIGNLIMQKAKRKKRENPHIFSPLLSRHAASPIWHFNYGGENSGIRGCERRKGKNLPWPSWRGGSRIDFATAGLVGWEATRKRSERPVPGQRVWIRQFRAQTVMDFFTFYKKCLAKNVASGRKSSEIEKKW